MSEIFPYTAAWKAITDKGGDVQESTFAELRRLEAIFHDRLDVEASFEDYKKWYRDAIGRIQKDCDHPVTRHCPPLGFDEHGVLCMGRTACQICGKEVPEAC